MTATPHVPAVRPQGLVDPRRSLGALAACALIAAVLPVVLARPAILSVLTVMFVWMAVNTAWNLVLGYAGMLSFGQLAFFAIGAYAATILNAHLGVPAWADTLLGGVAAAVTALAIGLAALRLRGVYVALVTLAFHELLRSLVSADYSGLTGGPNGLTASRYIDSADLLVQARAGYAIALAAALLVALLVMQLLRSPIGLALVAVRDAEHVATARGVKRLKYQLLVFVLSGCIAGLMGGFYAHYVGVVSPTLFSFGIVITLLSMIIIGGWGTFWGPIVGTLVLSLVTYWLQGEFPQYQSLIVAVILVVMVVGLRNGIVGTAVTLLRRRVAKEAP